MPLYITVKATIMLTSAVDSNCSPKKVLNSVMNISIAQNNSNFVNFFIVTSNVTRKVMGRLKSTLNQSYANKPLRLQGHCVQQLNTHQNVNER